MVCVLTLGALLIVLIRVMPWPFVAHLRGRERP